MLDTDGDGEIDYEEFSRWFGSGPPPPPMTPCVACGQRSARVDPCVLVAPLFSVSDSSLPAGGASFLSVGCWVLETMHD